MPSHTMRADGDYCTIWMNDNSAADIAVQDAQEVDGAVQRWVDSGRTRDTILHLTTSSGATLCVLASTINSWQVSTPVTREQAATWEKERKAWRSMHGLD